MNKDFKIFTNLNLKIFLWVFFGFLGIGVISVLLSGIGAYNRVMFLTGTVVTLLILILLVRLFIKVLGTDRLKSLDNTIHTLLMTLQSRVNSLFSRS